MPELVNFIRRVDKTIIIYVSQGALRNIDRNLAREALKPQSRCFTKISNQTIRSCGSAEIEKFRLGEDSE